MLHNKEGNLVTNKEQTWINGKQSKIDEIDIKESTREQSLETENDMVQPRTKSEIIKFYEVIYKILTQVCTSDSKVDRSSI